MTVTAPLPRLEHSGLPTGTKQTLCSFGLDSANQTGYLIPIPELTRPTDRSHTLPSPSQIAGLSQACPHLRRNLGMRDLAKAAVATFLRIRATVHPNLTQTV